MAEDEDDISALLRVRNALIDEYPAAFEDVPLNQQFSASQQAILANILTVNCLYLETISLGNFLDDFVFSLTFHKSDNV
jgi:hypothetical protein